MKAAILHGPEDLRVQDVPEPAAGPGEVLVRVEAATTCGTDVKMWRRGHPILPPYPAPFGHEMAGIRADTGERDRAAFRKQERGEHLPHRAAAEHAGARDRARLTACTAAASGSAMAAASGGSPSGTGCSAAIGAASSSAKPPRIQRGARQICGRPAMHGAHAPQATESPTMTAQPPGAHACTAARQASGRPTASKATSWSASVSADAAPSASAWARRSAWRSASVTVRPSASRSAASICPIGPPPSTPARAIAPG